MHIEEMNPGVLQLDDAHPAKKFLSAFISCRLDCVGREQDWGGHIPIEQEWISSSDGKVWTFSEFAYTVLSFDIELDGFLRNLPYPTESETCAERQMPLLRSLMQDCDLAAQRNRNSDILELTNQVTSMLNLWEEYLPFRKDMISRGQ